MKNSILCFFISCERNYKLSNSLSQVSGLSLDLPDKITSMQCSYFYSYTMFFNIPWMSRMYQLVCLHVRFVSCRPIVRKFTSLIARVNITSITPRTTSGLPMGVYRWQYKRRSSSYNCLSPITMSRQLIAKEIFKKIITFNQTSRFLQPSLPA